MTLGRAEWFDDDYLASVGLRRLTNPEESVYAPQIRRQRRIAREEYGLELPSTFEIYAPSRSFERLLDESRS